MMGFKPLGLIWNIKIENLKYCSPSFENVWIFCLVDIEKEWTSSKKKFYLVDQISPQIVVVEGHQKLTGGLLRRDRRGNAVDEF